MPHLPRCLLRRIVPHLALLAALFCLSLPATAHGLRIVAHAQDGLLLGQALYSDLSSASGLAVDVLDAHDGSVIASGQTGEDGRFRVPVPARVSYRAAVEGDEGHRSEIVVKQAPPYVAADSGETHARQSLDDELARLRMRELLPLVAGVLGMLGLAAWWVIRRSK